MFQTWESHFVTSQSKIHLKSAFRCVHCRGLWLCPMSRQTISLALSSKKLPLLTCLSFVTKCQRNTDPASNSIEIFPSMPKSASGSGEEEGGLNKFGWWILILVSIKSLNKSDCRRSNIFTTESERNYISLGRVRSYKSLRNDSVPMEMKVRWAGHEQKKKSILYVNSVSSQRWTVFLSTNDKIRHWVGLSGFNYRVSTSLKLVLSFRGCARGRLKMRGHRLLCSVWSTPRESRTDNHSPLPADVSHNNRFQTP